MTGTDFKVSDKRMFTADGRLREEYRHLEDSAPEPAPASAGAPEAAEPPVSDERDAPVAAAPERAAPPAGGAGAGVAAETGASRSAPLASDEPSILDLVALLAEHTALYLGEVPLPDGQTMRDLRAAKLHLDLLDVVRKKTEGNLTQDESRVLDDILYRLRMIYVEKKRQGE